MSFENAARRRYRFPSNRGPLSAEDLWQLPLQAASGFDLDGVAKVINRELKARAEESFVTTKQDTDKTALEEQLALVVHVIKVKQEENEKAANAAVNKAKRDRLNEILHLRTQQDLMEKSPEEIQAMIDELA